MIKHKIMLLSILKNLFALLVTMSMLIPIAMVFINSMKTKGEASNMSFTLPKKVIWNNYSVVIEQGKLIGSFINSMTYSVVSVLLIVFFASTAAYVLSRNRTKLHNLLYIYIVLGLTLSLNHIALINIMKTIRLLDTRLGIIILYTAIQIPFAVFLIYGFISTVPRDLDEAGIVDGCNPIQLFCWIVFPILKPAIVSVGILNFLNTWNEFTLPLYYLSDSKKWPMTNSIYVFYGQYSASWNLVCANIVLTSIPVIAIYLMGQKYIVEGMTAGAVKG